MNIYLLTQTEHTGYDTYSGLVVAAENYKAAQSIHPNTPYWTSASWASKPENVKVELLGKAAEGIGSGIILAAFNAA